MTIVRIVPNLTAKDPAKLAAFYRELLGLDLLMEMSFVSTVGTDRSMPIQLSLASEGGSGAEVPALSIEVLDLDPILEQARALNTPLEYGPTIEPWGVRRFFLRDPDGHLVNILCHH